MEAPADEASGPGRPASRPSSPALASLPPRGGRAGQGRALSLSLQLRADTADAHRRAEKSLGLPGAIRGRADYVACLASFYLLYRPLEARLREFGEWSELALDLDERAHAPRLKADLDRLGAGRLARSMAGAGDRPDLPDFAHALGALYVLEGSTLGGQIVLRHLRGVGIEGAETAYGFLGGRESRVGPLWRSFRDALDRYGEAFPARGPAVIEGAERTFGAIGRWMHVDRWRPA